LGVRRTGKWASVDVRVQAIAGTVACRSSALAACQPGVRSGILVIPVQTTSHFPLTVTRSIWLVLLCATCLVLAACGGATAFSDTRSLVIQGQPPAPPPPPEPPPPAAKRVEVTADKIVIREKIQFDFDKATIKAESNGLLDEITSVVKDNPQLRKISIEGHTDSDGADAYNAKLSSGRAGAVMAYLVSHGIEPERLSAKGHGESKPIASNDDADGKERNRRVEFIITHQDKVETTYEIDPKTGERKAVGTRIKKAKEKKKP
jgi:outer membrane protein OmpA-like peptidoglycan-associated protein